MTKQLFSALKISLLALILSFGMSYALAWTAPTTTPPAGNVAAPINTSATAQTKAGNFTAPNLIDTSTTTQTKSGNLNLYGTSVGGQLNIKTPNYDTNNLQITSRDIGSIGSNPLYLNYPNSSGDVQVGGEGETKNFTVVGNGNFGSNGYFGGTVGIGTGAGSYGLTVNAPADNWKAQFGGTDGFILIGPANSGWAHIYTDRPAFIFNTDVYSMGGFSSYSGGGGSGDLALKTGGTTRMTIQNSTGNVGIGTATPTQKLDVVGNANFTGWLHASDLATNGGGVYTNLVQANSVNAVALRVTGGNTSPGNVLTSDQGGNATWQAPTGGSGGVTSIVAGSNVTISPASGTGAVTVNAVAGAGDNLGNHTATQNLNMNGYSITGAGSATFTNAIISARGIFANGQVDCMGGGISAGLKYNSTTRYTCNNPYVRLSAVGTAKIVSWGTLANTLDAICFATGGFANVSYIATGTSVAGGYFNGSSWSQPVTGTPITSVDCAF